MPRFCHICAAALAETGAFCSACGTPVQPRAAPVQQDSNSAALSSASEADRRMRFRLGLGVAALSVLLLGIIVVFANRSSSTDAGTAAPAAQNVEPSAPPVASTTARMRPPPTPADPVPSFVPTQQTTFTSVVESFIPIYEQADTEIRKTNVRFERKEAIAQYFAESGDLGFKGWVGQVEWLHTESDGEAAVSVKLSGSKTVIKTWSNSLSDSSSHTMISRNDSLYPALMDIKQGDTVTVSGTFVRNDSGQDYVTEASVTEEGSMSSPELIVRFSQIKPGLPAPTARDNTTTKPSPALAQRSPVPTTNAENPMQMGKTEESMPGRPPSYSASVTAPSPQLQFESGVRVFIHVVSISRQPDGGFTFRGTLLQPVALAGAAPLDQGTELAGSGTANGGHVTVLVTGFTVRGENYGLQPAASGANKRPGSGPAIETDPGKVIEMWFASASVYDKTTSESH
jgi:hypothetical protein